MSEISEYYKPLRNRLRQLDLLDSFHVVHAYATHLCYGSRIPGSLEVARWFLRATHWHEKRVLPWELETLTAELLVHADELPHPKKTLRSWDYFCNTINRIKDLDGAIAREYKDLFRERLLTELFRIAHRQFPWQLRGNQQQIIRYLRLYNQQGLSEMTSRAVALTTDDLFAIGLALNGHYLKRLDAALPLSGNLPGITPAKLNSFLESFATDLDTLRADATDAQCLNEDFFYTFNPLRARPLITVDRDGSQRLLCPLPPLLLNAITDGFYYRIASTPSALTLLGSAFQQYVGDVLNEANDSTRLIVTPEAEYRVGRNRKDTVDWLVRDDTAAILTEVKTKRVRWEAHERLGSDDVLQSELGKLASFVAQLYATLVDFTSGRYPSQFGPAPETIYPIIVTLEDWHMFGNPVWQSFREQIQDTFARRELDIGLLDQHPLTIASIDEFEELALAIANEGIEAVLGPKLADSERRLWSLGAYFQNRSTERPHRQLFESDFHAFLRRVQSLDDNIGRDSNQSDE